MVGDVSVLVAKSNNDKEWYVDSGATKYMTNIDVDMEIIIFFNINKIVIKYVVTGYQV